MSSCINARKNWFSDNPIDMETLYVRELTALTKSYTIINPRSQEKERFEPEIVQFFLCFVRTIPIPVFFMFIIKPEKTINHLSVCVIPPNAPVIL